MNRIGLLDALRGFAVLGLLFAHFPSTGGTASSIDYPPALGWEAAHSADWVFTAIFIDGAMRGLFATLFGASMVLMIYGGAPGEAASRRIRFAARCAGLLLIGAVHVALAAWPSDILWIYAIAGLTAMIFIALPPAVMAGLFATAMALFVAHAALTDISASPPEAAALVAEAAARSAPYPAQILRSISTWLEWLTPVSVLVRLCEAGGYMMLGAALMKSGLLTNPPRKLARTAALIALPLGTALCGYAALCAIHLHFQYVADLHPLMRLGKPFIVIGFIALFALALTAPTIARTAEAVLAPVGRLALTAYVGSSVAMLILFTGAGFNLHGRFDRIELALLAALCAALLVVAARLWTRHMGQGPLERVLRGFSDALGNAVSRSAPASVSARPEDAGAGRSR